MIALGNQPIRARDAYFAAQATSSSRTASLTESLTKVARAVRANRNVAEQANHNLHNEWANGTLNVREHVDFAQLFADSYGDQWKHWQRGLNEGAANRAETARAIAETMSSDSYSNFLTTVIRFGMIESAELAPMPLQSIIDRNLRLAPGTVKMPVVRSVADIVDDGVAEWEQTVTKGVPAANMVTSPKARKMRLAFKMSREMMVMSDLANGYIRDLMEKHAEALNLHIEKLVADMMFGLYDTSTPSANPFPYILDDIQWNTYQTTGPWVNDITGAALDGTQVPLQMLEAAIEAAVDPYSGELVDYSRNSKLVVTNRNAVELAKDALGAVHLVRDTTSVAGNARQEIDRDAGSTRFQVAESDIVVARHARPRIETWMQTAAGGGESGADAKAKAGTIWLYGDTMRAFKYGVEWERERVELGGTNTQAYFNDDTIMQLKWTEKATPAVFDPIRVIRCRATPTS